jgi:hypothetical protein
VQVQADAATALAAALALGVLPLAACSLRFEAPRYLPADTAAF